jgi:hypothetical protein
MPSSSVSDDLASPPAEPLRSLVASWMNAWPVASHAA